MNIIIEVDINIDSLLSNAQQSCVSATALTPWESKDASKCDLEASWNILKHVGGVVIL